MITGNRVKDPEMSKKKRKIVYWYVPAVLTIISLPIIGIDYDSLVELISIYLAFSFLLFLFYLIASVVIFHAVDLLSAGWNGIRKRNSN
jgi:hypothetical protein